MRSTQTGSWPDARDGPAARAGAGEDGLDDRTPAAQHGETIGRWLGAAVLAGLAIAGAARRTVEVARRRWAAAAPVVHEAVLAASDRARAWTGRGASAAGGALEAAAGRTHASWRRAQPRLAEGAREAGWWLAAALVLAIERSEQGVRAGRRAASVLATASREMLAPRLVRAAEATSRFLDRAEVVADHWATIAGIEADGWRMRLADWLAVAAVHAERACMWASPHVSVLTGRAGRAASAASNRWLHPVRLLRNLAVAGVLLVAPAGAVLAFGVPAAEVALRSVQVDVTPPGPFPSLAERSVVVDAEGSRLALLHDAENRVVVEMDDIPEHVRQAVIAAEDRRFYEHDGYDVAAIGRALRENIEATSIVQGGSTITQQLAKLNYVGDDQSVHRKVEELLHAIGLEEAHDKDGLLWRYLNQVYFGSAAHGIGAAAEEFFRSEPADLTVGQAALLASQIRAPGAVDPRADPEAAAERRDLVLERMVAEGFLEPAEAEEARAEPVEVEPPLDQSPTEPYVVEAVKREFLANEAFGETREERLRALFGGGLRIETTVDPALQLLAHDVVRQQGQDGGGPTAAIAAVEPETGRILAMAGGTDFEDRRFDLATQSRRQPGSAFKTFALVAALEAGLDPRHGLDGDSPAEHSLPHDQEWTVHNFGGQSFGDVDLRQALVRSINTAFAEVALEIGHDRIVDVASRLGVPEAAFGEPSSHGPAVALGGLTHGVSPLEMAGAYAALVNGGRFAPPFLIERVIQRDGDVLYERETGAERVIPREVADTTVEYLQDAVHSGTGRAAQISGWTVAGKTGTTQNSADAWFVGAVPPLSAAVWVGHPDAQTPVPGLTGGSAAAPMWQAFVAEALATREPEGDQ